MIFLKRLIALSAVFAMVLAMIPVLPIVSLATALSGAEIYDLMTNDMVDPVGLDDPNPIFSWKMKDSTLGQKQTAYQITVKTGNTTVWDSGKVESGISVGIVYDGTPLQSSTAYTWSVTVWDKDGKTITSPEASFEIALLEENAFDDTYFISYDEKASSITEYTVDFRFVIDGGAVTPVFGATDENNCVMWQIRGDTGKLRPHVRTAGAYKIYELDISAALGGTGTAVYGKIYYGRVVVKGATMTGWIGQSADSLVNVGSVTHTKSLPLNMVGVRQAGRESGRLDDFKVTLPDNTVYYSNTFDSAAASDISGPNAKVQDGWLVMDGAREVVYLQSGKDAVPAYRKSITVKEGLVSAKLYTAGLGVYESYINGQRVGRKQNDGTVQYDELKPGFTQRNRRQYYSTFDVTWMLSQGENILGGVVTNGWWKGIGAMLNGKETAYLAKMILTYSDGTQEIINTDTTWKADRKSALQKDTGIFPGERYDASIDQGWMLPGYDDSTWKNVKINTEFEGELDAWEGVPIIVRDDLERKPQSMTVYQGSTGASDTAYGDVVVVNSYSDGDTISLKAGQTLLVDFGQNFSGWEFLRMEGAKDTVVTVEHGEWLNEEGGSIDRGNDGPGGSIYNANYRKAVAKTVYTMSGNGVEEYHPSFSFYGFQYIEITATADITVHQVRGQVVTSVHNDTATMVTSDEDVNQLISNSRWGMYSNYLSIPTDCPQRDERMGWTGDTQVFAQAGTYLTYAKSFLEKYLQDMRDAQLEATGKYVGAYADIAPLVTTYGGGSFGEVGWGDAGIVIPWYLYMMYGDVSVIKEHWESMRMYMDVYMESTDGKGPTGGAGEWLSPEQLGQYDLNALLGVAYYAWDALMMVDMANAIGETEVAAKYQAVYERQKGYFQKRFVLEDGTVARQEQTAYLMALYLDLLPNEESVAAVTNQLVSSIESYGNRMMTGFLGTAIVTKTLTKIGRADLAYALLLQHEYPSWLYSVDQGANTMWERWETYTEADGFGDVSMNSFNHYAYGAVAGWLFQTVAGIGFDSENPGFKNILLAPEYDAGLPGITASYESAYGLIQTESSLAGKTWTYKATIPANTTATAKIPVTDGAVVKVNGKLPSELTLETDGIVYTGTVDGKAEFEAVAGSFTFSVTQPDVEQTVLDWSQPQWCQHCKKNVTWTKFGGSAAGGHYYLAEDYKTTKTIRPFYGCLHLNGKTLAKTNGTIMMNHTYGTLSIMDHAENLGVVMAKGDGATRAGVINVVNNGVVLNLYGGTFKIQEGTSTGSGGVIRADKNTKVNMYGGVITGGSVSATAADKNGGNVALYEGAVFTMYGGTISAGQAIGQKGGNIYINGSADYPDGAAFVMHGGVVQGGNADQGGSICAEGNSSVVIHGGSILNGNAAISGGNIHMEAGTKLTIDEDVKATLISGGIANHGGNISLVSATATMDAGTVIWGKALGSASTDGGGNIYLDAQSSFTLNEDAGKTSLIRGGFISINNYGANIHNFGTFTMNGGRVDRGAVAAANTGGGNLATRKTATINGGFIGDTFRGYNVLVVAGKLTVSGGVVSGGYANGQSQRNITLWDNSEFSMTNGELISNYSSHGGALYADKGAKVTITGGTVSGNALSDLAFDLSDATNVRRGPIVSISNATVGSIYVADSNSTYDPSITLSGKLVVDSLVRGGTTKPAVAFDLAEGASVRVCDETVGEIFGSGSSAAHITSNNHLTATLDGSNLKWEATKYTVIFQDEDGKEYASGSYVYGDTITVPADPEKEGYVFAGWTPELSQTVSGDATYTAQWTSKPSVAQIGNKSYETLTDALAEAKANDQIDLLTDTEVDELTVNASVKLNLNGHKLTIKDQTQYVLACVKGAVICDTSEGNTGRLVIPMENLRMVGSGGNGGYLPVNMDDGIMFAKATSGQQKKEGRNYQCWIDSADDALLDALKTNEASKLGLKFQTIIRWGNNTLLYTYTDATVAKYMEKGWSEFAIYLKLNGADGITDLTYQSRIVSGEGYSEVVVWASEQIPHNAAQN